MESTQEENEKEEDNIQEIARLRKNWKRPSISSSEGSSVAAKKRTTNNRGALDYFSPKNLKKMSN